MKAKNIKFNVLDFFIIMAIIIVAAVIVFRGGLKDSIVAMRSNETIVYTVKINNLQKASFDVLELGDELYSKSDDKLLGQIVDKASAPATHYISLSDGTLVKSEIPDRLDIFLTVEGTGRITDEGCMLGGNYFVAAGKYISGYTDSVTFGFEITDAYKKQ